MLLYAWCHIKMLHLFECESKGAVRRNWSTSFQEATGTGTNTVRLIQPQKLLAGKNAENARRRWLEPPFKTKGQFRRPAQVPE